MSENPDMPIQALQRATALLLARRPDLAEAAIREHLVLNPDDAEAHARLAQCLVRLGKLSAAIAEGEKAVCLNATLPLAREAFGVALYADKQYHRAMEQDVELVRLEPNCAENYALLAMTQVACGAIREALGTAEEGLKLDPSQAECQAMRADALSRLGRLPEARESINAALATNPDHLGVHTDAGWVCLRERDYAASLGHFKEALRLEPQSREARKGARLSAAALHPVAGPLFRYTLRTRGWPPVAHYLPFLISGTALLPLTRAYADARGFGGAILAIAVLSFMIGVVPAFGRFCINMFVYRPVNRAE